MRRKHSNPRILPFPRAQCPDGRSWLPTDARPREMIGEDMVTYINKKWGERDDRISSIQIRWVEKKLKGNMKEKKRKVDTPCFLSWISGVTIENTKTG
jgi:hypothetical protein